MKCPYRLIRVNGKEEYPSTNFIEKEDFAECYGRECPYYQEWWSDNTKKYEPICGKASIEISNAEKAE